jgi:hypothetical protein
MTAPPEDIPRRGWGTINHTGESDKREGTEGTFSIERETGAATKNRNYLEFMDLLSLPNARTETLMIRIYLLRLFMYSSKDSP